MSREFFENLDLILLIDVACSAILLIFSKLLKIKFLTTYFTAICFIALFLSFVVFTGKHILNTIQCK